MIPKNIKREHILKAIEDIEKRKYNIPKNRKSTKFYLRVNGKTYPPKYVISLANKYANGEFLDSKKFEGGKETNNFLKKLGFEVIDRETLKKENASNIHIRRNKKKENKSMHKGERCPYCKETIKKLLEKAYGKVYVNYKFKISVSPEDFKQSKYYSHLKKIFEELQKHRGFKEFVKAKTLPNCDFFIPESKSGFILEFDESQHFTLPRKLTLENYPSSLKLGFDKETWIKLCEKINSKDNDPPYRDEQRAWYDTLRDFLPFITELQLKPTVRLFAKDFSWCMLNPEDPDDIEFFKKMIEQQNQIPFRMDPESFLARIIIAGNWKNKPEYAKRLLEKIYESWPKGTKTKFIITCGGFINFNWPREISKKEIGDSKNPNEEVVNYLIKKAEEIIKAILTPELWSKLELITDYLTIGIDSIQRRKKDGAVDGKSPHIELVCTIDLKKHKFYWTGKFYPVVSQENGLVRISDLGTHFLDLDVGKVMVLGCHDLNVFNPRSIKNSKGWRKKLNEKFRELARKEKPEIVLHHPHVTTTKRTWLNAFACMKKEIPSVKFYAGAGMYNQGRESLFSVLKYTKCGSTIDFIITNRIIESISD